MWNLWKTRKYWVPGTRLPGSTSHRVQEYAYNRRSTNHVDFMFYPDPCEFKNAQTTVLAQATLYCAYYGTSIVWLLSVDYAAPGNSTTTPYSSTTQMYFIHHAHYTLFRLLTTNPSGISTIAWVIVVVFIAYLATFVPAQNRRGLNGESSGLKFVSSKQALLATGTLCTCSGKLQVTDQTQETTWWKFKRKPYMEVCSFSLISIEFMAPMKYSHQNHRFDEIMMQSPSTTPKLLGDWRLPYL